MKQTIERGRSSKVAALDFYWLKNSLTSRSAHRTEDIQKVLPLAFPNGDQRRLMTPVINESFDAVEKIMTDGALMGGNGVVYREDDRLEVCDPERLQEQLTKWPILAGYYRTFINTYGIDLSKIDGITAQGSIFLYIEKQLKDRLFYKRDHPFWLLLGLNDGGTYTSGKVLDRPMNLLVEQIYRKNGFSTNFISPRTLVHAKLRDLAEKSDATIGVKRYQPFPY